ncbi:MAG: hypothetical protein CMN76_01900 [Spirochaetaceae bacterium]|nr:hypothetical protein [Spirochaetaceae bacterium]|tara:strand:- start:33604 stop:34209 length:606 start_codon:yes stop_codon:yes gene_type:complete
MGRDKKYHREELLGRALQLFWQRGYNATSTAELVEELGVNRKTMYSEFGSKEALFTAVLDHYNQSILGHILAPIEAEDASIEGIKELFLNLAVIIEKNPNGPGCLMCQAASERAAVDCDIAPYIDRYFERIEEGFRHALQNAQADRHLNSPMDVSRTAAFLTTCFIGAVTGIRAGAPSGQIRSTYETIRLLLDSNAGKLDL